MFGDKSFGDKPSTSISLETDFSGDNSTPLISLISVFTGDEPVSISDSTGVDKSVSY